MQIRSGGRLSAALVCVCLLSGNAVAGDGDATSAIDALRDIAVRVDTATRETLAAHAGHGAVAAHTVDATKRARAELDAIVRAAPAQGFVSDASYARKQRQVGKLLANLERAGSAAADVALPALAATNDKEHTARVALSTTHGATCASALTIAPGQAIETILAAAGTEGATLWLRVAPAKKGYTRLDTMPTPLDTDITLFGTACPASESEAKAYDDDAFGLAAAVAIDAAGGVRYARVRNLGHAGRVVARVDTAAAILGRTTDERNGHSLSAIVATVTPDGYFGSSVFADPTTGLYLLTADAGTYYVMAEDGSEPGYVTELYPDAPCNGMDIFNVATCDLADATVLTLGDGQQIAGIDIALNIGGRVAGTVRDAADGTPISSAVVDVFDPAGNYFNRATDAAGRYTISGLVTGTYYVVAGAQGYGGQVWDHIACGPPVGSNCQPLDGTPLAVVRDALASGVDFDLPRQAHIHATVSARDGDDAEIGSWSIFVYAADGTFINQYLAFGSGSVDTGSLPPGSYRAFAEAAGHFGQVWNGIDCTSDCSAELAQGNLISLTEGAEADVSFALLSFPTVSGTVTDAQTHAPIYGAAVALVPVGSTYSNVYAYSDGSGHFTITPYQTGAYYVWSSESTHRGTVYPDAPCGNGDFASCDLATAVPVTIALGGPSVTGADIAMPVDGSIAGHVTIRVPDGVTPITVVPFYEHVYAYDAAGNYAGSGAVDTDGSYVVPGLPAGTYYAVASDYTFSQIYDGLDCGLVCQPDTGTPIVIAQGENVTGIDFDPIPPDYIFGRVTDGSDAGVPGVAIDLWDANDGEHCGVGVTNADGWYALQDTSYSCGGLFRLSTDTTLYENQVYDGLYCPAGSVYLGLCGIDGGTDVTLPTTPVFVIADFVLGPRPETIFANGFDP
jgi:protocatechuate 3,4-dioxygenase beta subunit